MPVNYRLGWLALLLSLTGCTHRLSIDRAPTYVVQTPVIPTLTRGGSADVDLNLNFNNVSGKVAISPLRGLTLMAAGQYFRADKGADHLRNGEIGLAFARPNSAGTYFGLAAGVGQGQGQSRGHRYETWWHYSLFSMSGSAGTSTEYDSLRRSTTSRYTTYYLMPFAFRQMIPNKVELAGALRFNLIEYQSLRVQEDHWVDRFYPYNKNYRVSQEINGDGRRRAHLLFCLLAAQALTPHIWFVVQQGAELSLQPQRRIYDYRPMYTTLGLRLRL